jgi:hypothetical protein
VLLASTERDGGTLTTTANAKTAVKTVSVGNITAEARLRGCFDDMKASASRYCIFP